LGVAKLDIERGYSSIPKPLANPPINGLTSSQRPSSAALVFTPFVMDQMQPMTQMTPGGTACAYVAHPAQYFCNTSSRYTKPPLGSETDILYYASQPTPTNPEVLASANVCVPC
jgi:hypothetical protein